MNNGLLSPGDRIGAYEVVSLLGKGGMGEVYRARDAKLNRDVAIKVLPPELAADADYRTRFEQEAQVLASLNHPNIAAIYGLEGNAIVMELVEGETLRTPLPVAEALPIARQIAEALEAAHERGIIHRDLKPGNVKVTPEGVVKVLDFGLAKSVEKGPQSSVITPAADSPTVRATQAGLILGTAGYMSPEQAAGKPVDRRADIWAFGVVLYELLVGERLFDGETISHTLADVLRKEIDFGKLPVETPPSIRELLRRCLDRNLKNRLSHITEARIAIDNAGAPPLNRPHRPSSRWPWAVGAALGLALGTLPFLHFNQKPPELPLRSFSFTPKGLSSLARIHRAVVSPDGQYVAYLAENKLWVRALDSENPRALEGTEGAAGLIWSPDSAQIAFVSGGELKRVPLTGGTPFVLAEIGDFRDGAWSRDGRTILVSIRGRGLAEVPSSGGAPKLVVPARGSVYYAPNYLEASGRRRLVLAGQANLVGSQSLALIDLDSGVSETIHQSGAYPFWSPAGYALFQTDGFTPGLWSLKLSPTTGKPEGVPVPVLNAGSDFSASADGTLVWLDHPVDPRRRLTWRDRQGRQLVDAGVAAMQISSFDLSPDGTRLAYVAEEQGNSEVWVMDLARGVRTRLTFSPGRDGSPVWSPSGEEIAFASENGGHMDVFVQSASGVGTPRPVLISSTTSYPNAWSPDGTVLLCTQAGADTETDLWAVKRKTDGTFDSPTAWLRTPIGERDGTFSPDGRFAAYESRRELFLRPAGDGGQWRIPAASGGRPSWSKDGKEIFYVNRETLMAVPIAVKDGRPHPGLPLELFRFNPSGFGVFRGWAAHPDGKRFLVSEPEGGDERPSSIHVIQNWPALLKEKSAP